MGSWLQAYNIEGVRFLVVDGNEHMRLLLVGILRSLGVHGVATAKDGEKALVAIADFQPDILLTELGLDHMGGIDLIRTIRKGHPGVSSLLPVIVCSSYTEPMFVQSARDAGMDEFVAKPVSARTIYDRIVSVINKRRPFIKAEMYLGPDRRRHHDEEGDLHRRKADQKPHAVEYD